MSRNVIQLFGKCKRNFVAFSIFSLLPKKGIKPQFYFLNALQEDISTVTQQQLAN